jgi:hypothetical protein
MQREHTPPLPSGLMPLFYFHTVLPNDTLEIESWRYNHYIYDGGNCTARIEVIPI